LTNMRSFLSSLLILVACLLQEIVFAIPIDTQVAAVSSSYSIGKRSQSSKNGANKQPGGMLASLKDSLSGVVPQLEVYGLNLFSACTDTKARQLCGLSDKLKNGLGGGSSGGSQLLDELEKGLNPAGPGFNTGLAGGPHAGRPKSSSSGSSSSGATGEVKGSYSSFPAKGAGSPVVGNDAAKSAADTTKSSQPGSGANSGSSSATATGKGGSNTNATAGDKPDSDLDSPASASTKGAADTLAEAVEGIGEPLRF
jgi:hypothetical protein